MRSGHCCFLFDSNLHHCDLNEEAAVFLSCLGSSGHACLGQSLRDYWCLLLHPSACSDETLDCFEGALRQSMTPASLQSRDVISFRLPLICGLVSFIVVPTDPEKSLMVSSQKFMVSSQKFVEPVGVNPYNRLDALVTSTIPPQEESTDSDLIANQNHSRYYGQDLQGQGGSKEGGIDISTAARALECRVVKAQEKFDSLDTDGDGKLGRAELKALEDWVWSTFCPGDAQLSEEQQTEEGAKLRSQLNSNQDQCVTFDEFEPWFRQTWQIYGSLERSWQGATTGDIGREGVEMGSGSFMTDPNLRADAGRGSSDAARGNSVDGHAVSLNIDKGCDGATRDCGPKQLILTLEGDVDTFDAASQTVLLQKLAELGHADASKLDIIGIRSGSINVTISVPQSEETVLNAVLDAYHNGSLPEKLGVPVIGVGIHEPMSHDASLNLEHHTQQHLAQGLPVTPKSTSGRSQPWKKKMYVGMEEQENLSRDDTQARNTGALQQQSRQNLGATALEAGIHEPMSHDASLNLEHHTQQHLAQGLPVTPKSTSGRSQPWKKKMYVGMEEQENLSRDDTQARNTGALQQQSRQNLGATALEAGIQESMSQDSSLNQTCGDGLQIEGHARANTNNSTLFMDDAQGGTHVDGKAHRQVAEFFNCTHSQRWQPDMDPALLPSIASAFDAVLSRANADPADGEALLRGLVPEIQIRGSSKGAIRYLNYVSPPASAQKITSPFSNSYVTALKLFSESAQRPQDGEVWD